VNGKTVTCKLTVSPVKVSKVKLNKTSATITIGNGESLGKKITLTATVVPANATNKRLTWVSSNPKVATVSSSGVVTSKGYGKVTITATAQDGSKRKATCTITVVAAKAASQRIRVVAAVASPRASTI
jgi:uncharacterized protein YjdB